MEKHKIYHPNTPFCKKCNVPAKIGKMPGELIHDENPFGDDSEFLMVSEIRWFQMLHECLKCPDCGHSWKPKQSEFNQAKFAIEMNKARNL